LHVSLFFFFFYKELFFTLEIPTELRGNLKDVTAYESIELVLECEFNKTTSDAIWMKDGVDVKQSLGKGRFAKKNIKTVQQLTIFDAKLEDTGKYTCSVKDKTAECQISVIG
jgi:hypothetical protein